MQLQTFIYKTGANNLTFVRNIRKKIWNIAGRSPQSRITRTHNPDAIKQTHVPIHRQTKVRDGVNGSFFENFNCWVVEVIRQLQRSFFLPAVGNKLAIERREFSLDFVGKRRS